MAPLLLPKGLRLTADQFAAVCEANPDAVLMARDLGMAPGFECVRMYRGGTPHLPIAHMFAAATLEIG